MSVIFAAATFANDAHAGQKRKYSGDPYILHCARVAARTMLVVPQEWAVAAAWLHDTIEDCGVSYRTIHDKFGLEVAETVIALTNPSKKYPHLSRPGRKEMDRNHLRKQSNDVKNIKAIDRIDNLREMGDAPSDFLKMYCEESRLLADCLACGARGNLLVEILGECEKLGF